jgi:hypothetical protein
LVPNVQVVHVRSARLQVGAHPDVLDFKAMNGLDLTTLKPPVATHVVMQPAQGFLPPRPGFQPTFQPSPEKFKAPVVAQVVTLPQSFQPPNALSKPVPQPLPERIIEPVPQPLPERTMEPVPQPLPERTMEPVLQMLPERTLEPSSQSLPESTMEPASQPSQIKDAAELTSAPRAVPDAPEIAAALAALKTLKTSRRSSSAISSFDVTSAKDPACSASPAGEPLTPADAEKQNAMLAELKKASSIRAKLLKTAMETDMRKARAMLVEELQALS